VTTILLSYRRDDAEGTVGRLYDRLTDRYGQKNVFRDIDAIPFGVDFRQHIRTYIERCDVFLAVIGPNWNLIGDNGRRRLSNPKDNVRIEIEAALEHGIALVPVCVDGASMPTAKFLPKSLRNFPYLNAATVHPGRDFESHVQRLIREVSALRQRPKGNSSPRYQASLGAFKAEKGAPQPTLEELLGSIHQVLTESELKTRRSTNRGAETLTMAKDEDVLDLVKELSCPAPTTESKLQQPGVGSVKLVQQSPVMAPEHGSVKPPRTALEEAALTFEQSIAAIRADMARSERKVVRKATVPGGRVTLYDDGSIEYEDAHGARWFKNFAELERSLRAA
jgi:hypothetical protein